MIDNYSLELLHTRVHLYNIHPSHKQELLGFLLPILLDASFFHITQSEHELSLMVDAKYASVLQARRNINSMPDTYAVLRIFQESHRINEQGIVAEISKWFATRDIPILYVNSFNNNFILLPEDRLDDLGDWIEV